MLDKMGYPDSGLLLIKKAARSRKTKIWGDVLNRLEDGNEINIDHLSRVTKKNDVVVVPGKVLGGGMIDHPVIIGAKMFSQSAQKKITNARGKCMTLENLIAKYPDGKGLRLLVG